MIAACLLTCDRPELTAITVRSFDDCNRNYRDALVKLHCDCGASPFNAEIAGAAGFRTLMQPAERVGQMACLLRFLEETKTAEWILWLENDWESVKRLPSDNFLSTCEADTIRLFGEDKFRSGKRMKAGRYRIGTDELIQWTPAMPGWERGHAHWGAGGTLIRQELLARQAHRERLKDVITANINIASLRPTQNIMYSIGQETTKGFIG